MGVGWAEATWEGEQTDEEMDGYVWDYSDYPECTGKPAAVETTAVETQSTENNG